MNNILNFKRFFYITAIIIFFITGLMIRIYFSSFHDGVIGDAEVYINAGKAIFDSSVAYSYQPAWPDGIFIAQPLYPFFIALFDLAFHDTLFAAQWVSIFFGSLMIIMVYLTASLLFNQYIGLISAFISAVYSVLIWNSLQIMTESLYTFIFVLIIYIIYQSLIKDKLYLFFLAGLTIGLGFLCRSFGLINLIVSVVVIIMTVRFHNSSLQRIMLKCLILIAGFLFITTPYFIYLRAELGEWTLGQQFSKATKGYEKVFQEKSVYIKGDAEEKVTYEVKDHSNHITFMIAELTHGYIKQFYKLIRSGDAIIAIFPLFFQFFIVIGVIYNKHDKSTVVNILLLTFLLSLPLFLPLLKVTNRYLSPVVPVGIMYMAAAVYYISINLSSRFQSFRYKIFLKKWFWSSIVLAVIFLINLPGLIDPMQKKSRFPVNYRHIGEWLKEYSPGKDFIMSNTFIDIYSDDYRFRIVKKDSFGDIYNFSKQKQVKFLVIENNIIQPYPKLTISDLSESDLQKLKLLKEFNYPRDIKIYQFIY